MGLAGFLWSLWQLILTFVGWLLAKLYEWCARSFEAGGVAARRRELIGTVAEGGSVLEVGAGTGATIAAGAYAGPPGRFSRVVVTEPDVGMRTELTKRVAETQGAAVEIEVSDARWPVLPYPDASFDAVVCFMVLSHVPKRDEAVVEAARVLKPGGKLLLMDHGAHDLVHGHGHGHGHGGHGHGHTGHFMWFREWLRFRPKEAKLETLLESFTKEERLKEDFVSKMRTKGFFVELCYGSFTRVSDR